MNVDVHVHTADEARILRLLETLIVQVAALTRQGDSIMTALDDLNDKFSRIDTATNNIAADVRSLKDQISTGMSPADVAAVTARLESTAVALEGIAAETPDAPAV